MSHWFEALRDRVVHRSQLLKGKLDATFARRQLDLQLSELGERFLALARDGRAAVPPDLQDLYARTRVLEQKLEGKLAQLAALKSEVA